MCRPLYYRLFANLIVIVSVSIGFVVQQPIVKELRNIPPQNIQLEQVNSDTSAQKPNPLRMMQSFDDIQSNGHAGNINLGDSGQEPLTLLKQTFPQEKSDRIDINSMERVNPIDWTNLRKSPLKLSNTVKRWLDDKKEFVSESPEEISTLSLIRGNIENQIHYLQKEMKRNKEQDSDSDPDWKKLEVKGQPEDRVKEQFKRYSGLYPKEEYNLVIVSMTVAVSLFAVILFIFLPVMVCLRKKSNRRTPAFNQSSNEIHPDTERLCKEYLQQPYSNATLSCSSKDRLSDVAEMIEANKIQGSHDSILHLPGSSNASPKSEIVRMSHLSENSKEHFEPTSPFIPLRQLIRESSICTKSDTDIQNMALPSYSSDSCESSDTTISVCSKDLK